MRSGAFHRAGDRRSVDRARAAAWVLMLGVALAPACSFDRNAHAGSCARRDDCGPNQECHRGFCVAAAGADLTGTPCDPDEPAQDCYAGGGETLGVGVCKAGARSCVGEIYTDCVGQVLPQPESCNGLDDDCNGEVDDLPQSTCSTGLPGACQPGTPVCQGSLAFCQPTALPSAETCDGADDDCDGMADDVSPVACYPASEGCKIDAQGRSSCTGLCRPGVTECAMGSSSCTGAVLPVDEACTSAGDTAADEDCDGEVDENCSCRDGDILPCYSGPQGSAGKGVCRAGVQTCAMRSWGSCQGEILPSVESCDNSGSDDDCNDTVDDVPGTGDSCYEPANEGICRDGGLACVGAALQCVTREPQAEQCDAVDQDCDGKGYNGYDLTSEATCGVTCARCTKLETCCRGACVAQSSFATDDANCGACGVRCGSAQRCCQGKCVGYASDQKSEAACACDQDCKERWCCGRQCLDLLTDEANCGGCGIVCGRGTTCCDGVCRALCLSVLGIEIAP